MTLKEVLEKTVLFFKQKNFESARLDTELLLMHGLGLKNRVDIYLKYESPLNKEELDRCRELVRRRSTGEPVAYIINEKHFFNDQFYVDSRVLIPRPETEILAEKALDWLKKNKPQSPKILDLGTGSGCLGLSLVKHFSDSQVTLVDISSDALAVAQKNAEILGLLDRVTFVHSAVQDLKFLEQSFDLVVANPPYISEDDPNVQESVKKFEPSLALFSRDNGYQDLKNWSLLSARWLKKPGFMGFELGLGQSKSIVSHFQNMNLLDQIYTVEDLSGIARHVIGVKNG